MTHEALIEKFPMWTEDNVLELKAQFQTFDVKQDGLIDFVELSVNHAIYKHPHTMDIVNYVDSFLSFAYYATTIKYCTPSVRLSVCLISPIFSQQESHRT